jgi:C1A family cysteine protease
MQRQFLKLEKLQARSNQREIKSSEISHFFDEVLHAQKSSSSSSHSLRELVTEVYDQGELGSCTANAFCAAYKILCKDKSFEPSRLFFYF